MYELLPNLGFLPNQIARYKYPYGMGTFRHLFGKPCCHSTIAWLNKKARPTLHVLHGGVVTVVVWGWVVAQPVRLIAPRSPQTAVGVSIMLLFAQTPLDKGGHVRYTLGV